MRVLVLLFTVTFVSVAQDYRPMVIEGATWHYRAFGEGYPLTADYFISGDTIHNGVAYKLLYVDGALGAFIREDVDEKRVYISGYEDAFIHFPLVSLDSIYSYSVNDEILLCDFNYSLGDPVVNYTFGEQRTDTVLYVSEMEIFGEDLKVWSLYGDTIHGDGEVSFVEGVGGLQVFVGNLVGYFVGGGTYLAEYCISNNGDCFSNTSEVEHTVPLLFPNPTTGEVYLEHANEVEKYLIFDVRGALLDQGVEASAINLGKFPTGSYTVRLQLIDGSTHQVQVLKK